MKAPLQAVIHEYEPAELPVAPRLWVDSLDKMLGDFLFTCNVNEVALAHSAHGGDTFYYLFTHRASQQTWPDWVWALQGYTAINVSYYSYSQMGVIHGYEINFIFGEPYDQARYHYSKEERELASRFMRYWANFARSGDPNKNPGEFNPVATSSD